MSTAARSEKLDLRLSPEAKRKIVEAAEAQHRSVTDFVLQSALERADEALANQTRFYLSAEDWEKFLAALDAPPRDNPRLREFLTEPSFVERSRKP